MNRRTEGGWRYFHRAIKTALAATNTLEPVSLDFHGRKVPASRVTITPYVGDAKRLPLNLLDALRALESDDVLRKGLGEPFISAYLKLKHADWNEFGRHLTEWERQTTLDC